MISFFTVGLPPGPNVRRPFAASPAALAMRPRTRTPSRRSGTAEQHGDVHMWTCKTKLVQNWSLYPVYHICLDYERLRLAQIVDLALEWGAAPTDIIDFRTDSVLIQKNLAAKFRQVRMCDLGFEGTALAYHVQQITIGAARMLKFHV